MNELIMAIALFCAADIGYYKGGSAKKCQIKMLQCTQKSSVQNCALKYYEIKAKFEYNTNTSPEVKK